MRGIRFASGQTPFRYNQPPSVETMIVARQYFVSGQVQGVGFRFFTQEAARREGLTGFVRNLDDGRVEAVAEGDLVAVARFERALHSGPSLARVADVSVEDCPPEQTTSGFEIRA